MMEGKPADVAPTPALGFGPANLEPPAGFQVEVRAHGFDLGDSLREHAMQHVIGKLDKYAHRIQAVIVRVEDLNGSTKGGLDKVCRLEILLSAMPRVVVEERHEDVYAAVDMAADRAKYVVQQHLGRRRSKPREQARKNIRRAKLLSTRADKLAAG